MSDVKTGFAPIIVTIALVAAALAVGPSVVRKLKDPGKPMVLNVGFLPAERSGERPPNRTLKDEVVIEVSVGRDTGGNDKYFVTKSPWQTTVYPNSGQMVELRATQSYGDLLGCIITQEGQPGVASPRKSGPGSVLCRMRSL